MEDGNSQPQLQGLEIQLMNTASSYEKKQYEASFRERYEYPDVFWDFNWNSSGVTIESISKGSEQDKVMRAGKSLEDLIELCSGTAFHKHAYDGGYLFTHDMIGWSRDKNTVETININFLQSDISRPDQRLRFESLVSQGLTQLFHTAFSYEWSITPYEKSVIIRNTGSV